MGSTAVEKHIGYEKYKQLVKGYETQSVLQFHVDNKSPKASILSNNNEKQKHLVLSSAVPTAAHKAEVLQAIQSVLLFVSQNSMIDFAAVFKMIFLDREMASKMELGGTKLGHIVSLDLTPNFSNKIF